jgi:LysR family transcriptional activator of mexEF-oprN operon
VSTYARDLDLNLLRVFVVVAEERSVTAAAGRLYLTQPAISAALKRLASAVGAPLFAKQGRGLVLTSRGARLLAGARPHLEALVEQAFAPAVFDPAASERTFRLGLADSSESWLLPELLRVLGNEAPRMKLIVLPVQFRTIAQAFTSGGIELAVTVADDLPAGIRRRALFTGGFVCLYDPRHTRAGKKISRERYLAHSHVIVSYNGDLRGLIEDYLGIARDVRVSVPTFHSIGAIVEGTALLATIPSMVARQILLERPKLRVAELPFPLEGTAVELLWRSALDDDPALRFVMDHVTRIALTRRGKG